MPGAGRARRGGRVTGSDPQGPSEQHVPPPPAVQSGPDTGAAPDTGAPAARSRRTILLTTGRVVLLLGVLAAAAVALARHWDSVSATIATMSWSTIVPSAGLVALGIACGTLSWQVLVDDLGEPIGAGRGAQIFLVGQLGKYLPGSVWAYLLQLELGRRAGLARARVFAATIFSLAVAVVAALVVGTIALPELLAADPSLGWLRWLYVLLPFGLICLHPRILTAVATVGFRLVRHPRPSHPVRVRTVVHSLAWALGSYLSYGLHLWLLARDEATVAAGELLLFIGVMGIAMVSGLVAVVLPSGAGIRELVLVTGLTPFVGPGTAIAYAAVSRVLFTVADLAMAGGAAALGVLARRREGAYQGDPEV